MMRIAKLDALKAWPHARPARPGVVTALIVWAVVWVIWTIRPFLAAGAAIAAVGWVLHSIQRHRRSRDWSGEEWIGS